MLTIGQALNIRSDLQRQGYTASMRYLPGGYAVAVDDPTPCQSGARKWVEVREEVLTTQRDATLFLMARG